DFNMLNIRARNPGQFEFRLARETPRFFVGIHTPGFLQYFDAGPFSSADVKNGVLKIDVPKPATLAASFDPGSDEAAKVPFKGVGFSVMRNIDGGDTYLNVLSDIGNSPRHEVRLGDLAPGDYLVTVRTQPNAAGQKVGSP